jgi:hypothetical protein
VLHERIDRTLGGRTGGQRTDIRMRRQRRQQHDAAVLTQGGQKLLHEEDGPRTFTAKRSLKSSTVVSSMVAAFEMPTLATRISSRSPTVSRPLEGEVPTIDLAVGYSKAQTPRRFSSSSSPGLDLQAPISEK